MMAMKSGLRFALLLPAAALLGCTLPPATSSSTSTPLTGNWTNWQIQAGTAITSPPNTYPSFVGALQLQGTQAAGVFTTVVAAGASGQALDYSGGFNSSTGDVELITQGYEFGFTEPSAPNALTQVAVVGGCVGSPPPACLAIFASPSVGVQIASLTGTYTGSLLNSSSPNLQNVSLTLTQSTTPNASGQFPLTATLVFLGSLSTYPMTGTVGGEVISLSYLSPAVGGPSITLAASTNPAGTQITVSSLTSSQTGPPSTTTGTLTRQ
jgi:hypothetical protein